MCVFLFYYTKGSIKNECGFCAQEKASRGKDTRMSFFVDLKKVKLLFAFPTLRGLSKKCHVFRQISVKLACYIFPAGILLLVLLMV